MPCLILAAGQGLRLRPIADSKPLAEVHGTALIERVIDQAREGGAREFVVVTGYEGDKVKAAVEEMGARKGVKVTTVDNAEWTRRQRPVACSRARTCSTTTSCC